jgi:aspartate/methionine/tyrosine aminotransferase
MMFSSRLPRALGPNALAEQLGQLRRRGDTWLDLTETNPTRVGLPYPADVLASLGDPAGIVYEPSPMGLAAARAAVAGDYARKGTPVDPGRVVLTASTSDAYAMLFKLLCDPGDEVLVPQPSYPLFDLLTRLEGVLPRPYRLQFDADWSVDRSSVDGVLSPRTRAILVVSPNNPTGSRLRGADHEWLAALCRARQLALIVDEVFIDYPIAPRGDAASALGHSDDVLTFSLGGLSKSAGLPQVKLGWMALDGPDAEVDRAIHRLELICDTYLGVSTPVQLAAPQLLAAGMAIRECIQVRIAENLRRLRATVARSPAVSLLPLEGGWSAVLRVPAVEPEESMVIRLLRESRVLVHPGYFFDFDREAYLVLSLLPSPEPFAEAIGRVLEAVDAERV